MSTVCGAAPISEPCFLKNKLSPVSSHLFVFVSPVSDSVFTDADQSVRLIPLLYCVHSFVQGRVWRRQILHIRARARIDTRLRKVQGGKQMRGHLDVCVFSQMNALTHSYAEAHSHTHTHTQCSVQRGVSKVTLIAMCTHTSTGHTHKSTQYSSTPTLLTMYARISAQTHTYSHACRHTHPAV